MRCLWTGWFVSTHAFRSSFSSRYRSNETPNNKKILIGFTNSICIIYIVRLCIMTTQLFHTSSTDLTWLFIGSSTWTAVETNIGIVSGNLSHPSCFNVNVSSCLFLSRPKSASVTDLLSDKILSMLTFPPTALGRHLWRFCVQYRGRKQCLRKKRARCILKHERTRRSGQSSPRFLRDGKRRNMGVSETRKESRDIIIRHHISTGGISRDWDHFNRADWLLQVRKVWVGE